MQGDLHGKLAAGVRARPRLRLAGRHVRCRPGHVHDPLAHVLGVRHDRELRGRGGGGGAGKAAGGGGRKGRGEGLRGSPRAEGAAGRERGWRRRKAGRGPRGAGRASRARRASRTRRARRARRAGRSQTPAELTFGSGAALIFFSSATWRGGIFGQGMTERKGLRVRPNTTPGPSTKRSGTSALARQDIQKSK